MQKYLLLVAIAINLGSVNCYMMDDFPILDDKTIHSYLKEHNFVLAISCDSGGNFCDMYFHDLREIQKEIVANQSEWKIVQIDASNSPNLALDYNLKEIPVYFFWAHSYIQFKYCQKDNVKLLRGYMWEVFHYNITNIDSVSELKRSISGDQYKVYYMGEPRASESFQIFEGGSRNYTEYTKVAFYTIDSGCKKCLRLFRYDYTKRNKAAIVALRSHDRDRHIPLESQITRDNYIRFLNRNLWLEVVEYNRESQLEAVKEKLKIFLCVIDPDDPNYLDHKEIIYNFATLYRQKMGSKCLYKFAMLLKESEEYLKAMQQSFPDLGIKLEKLPTALTLSGKLVREMDITKEFTHANLEEFAANK